MSAMASQITSLAIVSSAVYSGTDQRKHQSSASLAFVRWIYRWPVNSPHKVPVTRKMFPFDGVIMICHHLSWPDFELWAYVNNYIRQRAIELSLRFTSHGCEARPQHIKQVVHNWHLTGQKLRQGDCPGRHRRRWSLSSTSPVTSRAVALTTFLFQRLPCI